MNDQEKSVMLARAMGWKPQTTRRGVAGYPPKHENLYDPANMALAWRVLNWAMDEYGVWGMALAVGDFELQGWLYDTDLWSMPPADAQRLWLDKILELVIEEGFFEVENA